ncbi:MAG: condensation domain-containing protein, partial [Sheuella sp.]|nr:condensation domain-containing protein [Sheuella sp.]
MTTKISLSYGQRRLWTLDRIEQSASTYNMPIAMRLHGELNTDALTHALRSIIERHESLRTLITESENGHPAGILADVPNLQDVLRITDLCSEHTTQPDQCVERVNRLIREEASTAFNLAIDIPFRASLIVISPDEHILMLTMHHHAGDGRSWAIIGQELKLAYAALIQDLSPALPELQIQYSDWAHWQEAVLKKKLADKLSRSRERLSGIPEKLTLPLDHTRHPDRAHQAGYVKVDIPAKIVQGLENLARESHTTFFTVLLAAYGALLCRIAGQSTVVIGSPISGRTRTETEQIVGFFLNTLAIPVLTSNQSTTRELITQTKKQVESAIVDQDLPFELLVEEIGVARSLDHTPIFQTMLSYQNHGNSDFALAGTTVETVPVGLATTKFDLTLALEPLASGNVCGVFEYDADLFNESSVSNWSACLIDLTEAMLGAPDMPVMSLPMISKTQRATVLKDSCGPLVDLSVQPQSLPALFAAQVAASPDNPALIFELSADSSSSMRYDE